MGGGEALYVSMGNEYDKKYTWSIKNFSSLQSTRIYSSKFVAGGCNWCFLVFPKGIKGSNCCLSLYLNVVDSESLPSGWRRHVKFRLTIVNQLGETYSRQREMQGWFEEKTNNLGFDSFLPINELPDGFFVNRELMVVAEINVLEVIGQLDVTEETSPIVESMDVNGFHVLTSQIESVKDLFDQHGNIAANFDPDNQFLKTAYMNLLLGVTKLLSQSSLEISEKDMVDARVAVVSLKTAGFNLDWLEKRLEEVKKRKEIVAATESRNGQKHQGTTDRDKTGQSNQTILANKTKLDEIQVMMKNLEESNEKMKNLNEELNETMRNYEAACAAALIQRKMIN